MSNIIRFEKRNADDDVLEGWSVTAETRHEKNGYQCLRYLNDNDKIMEWDGMSGRCFTFP